MNKFGITMIIFLAISCTSVQGDIFRDLQHEVNEINIILTSEGLTQDEIQFLRGKSFGLHLAMEIISENGIM